MAKKRLKNTERTAVDAREPQLEDLVRISFPRSLPETARAEFLEDLATRKAQTRFDDVTQRWPVSLTFLYSVAEGACHIPEFPDAAGLPRLTMDDFREAAGELDLDHRLQKHVGPADDYCIAVFVRSPEQVPSVSMRDDFRLLISKLPFGSRAVIRVSGVDQYELSLALIVVGSKQTDGSDHDAQAEEIRTQGSDSSQTLRPEECTAQLEQMIRESTVTAGPLRERLQSFLEESEGTLFDTLDAKRQFTSTFNALLGRLGLRVECPTCGNPATLRAGMAGNAKAGVFRFEHVKARKTTHHHGRTRLPPLQLISSTDANPS